MQEPERELFETPSLKKLNSRNWSGSCSFASLHHFVLSVFFFFVCAFFWEYFFQPNIGIRQLQPGKFKEAYRTV